MKRIFCLEKKDHMNEEELSRIYYEKLLEGHDEVVRYNFKSLNYANNLKRIPKDGDPEHCLQIRSGIEQMPRYTIAASE